MQDRLVQTVFRRACGLLALIVLVADLAFTNASNRYDKTPERVIAIGDVHGDFDDFCLMLKELGLADSQNHWIGGKAILVQSGDVIDRGNKGREAMDLLILLEKEAAAAGGQVVPLLGNHEVMNILGDLRYVSAETYAEFADGESEKRRKAAYQDYAAWYTSHTKSLKAIQQTALPATEEEWMAKHPAGFLEYREALDLAGVYGKWVRQHAAVVKIGGVVFLHGGISPNLISLKLEQISSQVRQEIDEFDRTKRYLVSHRVILPFFTLQETAAAVQAQITADRAAETPLDEEERSMMSRHAYRRGPHGTEDCAHPMSLRRKGIPNRHRYAFDVLARRAGVGAGNPGWPQIQWRVSGRPGINFRGKTYRVYGKRKVEGRKQCESGRVKG